MLIHLQSIWPSRISFYLMRVGVLGFDIVDVHIHQVYTLKYFLFLFSVDATCGDGTLGRLVNHSSQSRNVKTTMVEVDDNPHLILTAAKDIMAKEELLYDYGDRRKDSIESHPWLLN